MSISYKKINSIQKAVKNKKTADIKRCMWYGSKVWHSTYKYRRVMCMLCRGIIFQQVFTCASGFFAIMYDLGAKTTRLLA